MKGYSLIPMALFSAALTLPAVALAAVPMEAAIAESANPSALQEGALQDDSAAQLANQTGAVDMPEKDLQPEDQEQDYATAGAAVGTVTLATARAPSQDVAAMAEENMAEEGVAGANGADVADPTMATAAPAANQQPATLNQQHSSPDYNPLIQGEANRGNVSPADLSAQPAPNTLQKKVKGPHGELLATQPGEVQVQENRRFKAP